MAFGKRLIDWLFHDNSNQLQKSNSSNAWRVRVVKQQATQWLTAFHR
jgi:hypothetical protein